MFLTDHFLLCNRGASPFKSFNDKALIIVLIFLILSIKGSL